MDSWCSGGDSCCCLDDGHWWREKGGEGMRGVRREGGDTEGRNSAFFLRGMGGLMTVIISLPGSGLGGFRCKLHVMKRER